MPFYRGRFIGCMRFTVPGTLHAMGFALEVVTLWAGDCGHGIILHNEYFFPLGFLLSKT